MRIDGFLDYLRHEKRYSDKTIVSYRKDLQQFLSFLELNHPVTGVEQVESKYIRNFMVYLLREKKLSSASIRRKLSSINTYFNFHVKRHGLAKNPAKDVSALKLPQRIPQYLTASSMEQMSDNLELDQENFKSLRTYLIIELLYNTGMRRQELIDLTWKDLNTERKNVRILGKGNKERLVPVSPKLLNELDVFKDMVKEEFGFLPETIIITDKGKKVYPRFIYDIVKKQLTEFSSLKKRSPHILRHTFATHLLNSGADLNDIKELLGHSSLASTQVYTHNSIEELKQIYKQAHPKSH